MRKLWSLLEFRGEVPPPVARPDNTRVSEARSRAEIDQLIDQLIEEQLSANIRFAKAHADGAVRSRADAPGVAQGPAPEGKSPRTRYLA